MRVLLCLQSLNPCWQALVQLLRRDYQLDWHILCNQPVTDEDRAALPIEHLETQAFRRKLDFAAIRTVRERLRQGHYDLVHALDSKSLAVVLQATRGVLPCPPILGYRGVTQRPSRFDPGNWLTCFHPRLSGIMCISQAVRRALVSSGVRAQLETIHLGESPDWYVRQGRPGLAPWGIAPEHFVVGSIANIRPIKGIDLLLRAIAQLPDLKQLRAMIIGKCLDPRVERLAQLPELRDRVVLVGQRRDAADLASGFDVYAQPSRNEGLCKALMAGMLQGGCPLITGVGGMLELVRDQQDGLVVPPEDVDALARGLRQLHDDPVLRQRLAESARHRLRTEFSLEVMAGRLYQFYEQTLGERRRAA